MTRFFYDIFQTNWGWVGAIGSDKGLRQSTLPEASPDRALQHLEPEVRNAEHRPGAFANYARQIDEYLAGERTAWEVRLDLSDAAPFFKRAWEACRGIPAGETRSYQWLAAQAGSPLASRAAGQAMARNRLPLIVPCHRVIGSDGGLHGFGGQGLPLKERLLQLEQGQRGVVATKR